MPCKFFIKNNEQEFKDSYFQAIKKDKYVYINDFNYYLITEKNELLKYYLFFALDSNRTKKYTDILYLVSNRFGNYVYKKRNATEWSKRYLMLIKDNYYFYYHVCKTPMEEGEICRILYLDDNLLSYDNDNLAWDTLTAKKIDSLMPFNAKKAIDKKLPLFIDKINSLRLINEL